MKRKTFLKNLGAGLAALQMAPMLTHAEGFDPSFVRLGGPVFGTYDDPGQWIELLNNSGYRAGWTMLFT